MWDEWNAIEAAQAKADAEDLARLAERKRKRAGLPPLSALQEAEQIVRDAVEHPGPLIDEPPSPPWAPDPVLPPHSAPRPDLVTGLRSYITQIRANLNRKDEP